MVPLNKNATNIFLSDMERELAADVNDLRANPGEWAEYLKSFKSGRTKYRRQLAFLKGKKALPPLKLSKGLCLAAKELMNDHGPRGLSGHVGTDGTTFFARIGKYGMWDGKVAGNLYYGYRDADRLMIGILTEGGSTGWDQRNHIFSADFKVMGIACGLTMYTEPCVSLILRKNTRRRTDPLPGREGAPLFCNPSRRREVRGERGGKEETDSGDGKEAFRQRHQNGPALCQWKQFDRDLANDLSMFITGNLYSRTVLTLPERQMAACAMLAGPRRCGRTQTSRKRRPQCGLRPEKTGGDFFFSWRPTGECRS